MPRLAIIALLAACSSVFARQPVRARHAMVVTQEPTASEVGLRVLKSGGNAIDAAVAVGFALAVTHPFAGNLGGGGFMLIRFADGRSTFIDFRERAPGAATRTMYLDAQGNPTRESLDGWRSSGVPGTVRGLEYVHKKYGQSKWRDVVNPAVDLAAKGFAVSYSQAESFRGSRNLTADAESKRIFLNSGRYFEPDDVLKQPELARTLARVARLGANDFYEGQTARTLVAAMEAHGGLIRAADLAGYQVTERKPLIGTYRGYEVISAPPPSSGGIGILQILGMLEGSGYEKQGPGSAVAIHFVTEAMRRFFADRSQYLGDPDFVKVPLPGLLDPAYIQKRKASITPGHATPSTELGPGGPPGYESGETTHFSVVDKDGNAVAVTYTLNEGYGNGITVPGLGFLLNDEMDDFTSKPGSPNLFGLLQGELNSIQPGKRPLSAMTPTILARDGKFFMSVGSPGGPRIISAVLETILNVIDFKMNAQDAVDAPRFHHQWMPDRLSLERGISPDTVALLQSWGHTIDYNPGIVLASVEVIVNEGKWLAGGSDGRRSGKAVGY